MSAPPPPPPGPPPPPAPSVSTVSEPPKKGGLSLADQLAAKKLKNVGPPPEKPLDLGPAPTTGGSKGGGMMGGMVLPPPGSLRKAPNLSGSAPPSPSSGTIRDPPAPPSPSRSVPPPPPPSNGTIRGPPPPPTSSEFALSTPTRGTIRGPPAPPSASGSFPPPPPPSSGTIRGPPAPPSPSGSFPPPPPPSNGTIRGPPAPPSPSGSAPPPPPPSSGTIRGPPLPPAPAPDTFSGSLSPSKLPSESCIVGSSIPPPPPPSSMKPGHNHGSSSPPPPSKLKPKAALQQSRDPPIPVSSSISPPPAPATGGLIGEPGLLSNFQPPLFTQTYQLPETPGFGLIPSYNPPFQIKVYKQYIPPSAGQDEMDLNLTFNQLVQDLSNNHPNIPLHEIPRLQEIVSRGHKIMAIQAASELPAYFAQKFPATMLSSPGGFCELCLSAKTLSVAKEAEILKSIKYDDVTWSKIATDTIEISTESSIDKFKMPNATMFINVLQMTVDNLKQASNIAVALANYSSPASPFSFISGALLHILERDTVNGWINGEHNGKSGWFPQELVEVLIESPQVDVSGRVVLTGYAKLKSGQIPVKARALAVDTNRTDELPQRMGPGMEIPESPVPSRFAVEYSASSGDLDSSSSPQLNSSFNDGSSIPTFLEWAQRNFMVPPESNSGTLRLKLGTLGRSGTLRTQKSEQENLWKEIVQRIKYSEIVIKTPLTRINDSNEAKLAIEIFQHVMMYMGDLPTKKTRYEILMFILFHAMKKENLTDEIFSQVIKQTTNNKSQKTDSLKKGWDLLLFLCTSVFPTYSMSPNLQGHLTASVQQKREFWNVAEQCLDRIKKNKMNSRKMPPCLDEFNAIDAKTKHILKVYFVDGLSKSYCVESHTLAKDIHKSCCEKYEIKTDQDFYGLFITFEPGDFSVAPVSLTDHLADTLYLAQAKFDMNRQIGRVEFEESHVVFRRKIWAVDKTMPSDSAASLMFHQIVSVFTSGSIFTEIEMSKLFRENVAQLVAILLNVRKVEIQDFERVKNFIPPICRDSMFTQSEWQVSIQKHMQKFGKIREIDAMRLFMEQMRIWKNFGATFFKTTSSNDSRFSNGCILAVGYDGLKIVDKSSRKILDMFTYENIMNFRFDETEFSMRGTSSMTGNPKAILRFETRQGQLIADILNCHVQIIVKAAQASVDRTQFTTTATFGVPIINANDAATVNSFFDKTKEMPVQTRRRVPAKTSASSSVAQSPKKERSRAASPSKPKTKTVAPAKKQKIDHSSKDVKEELKPIVKEISSYGENIKTKLLQRHIHPIVSKQDPRKLAKRKAIAKEIRRMSTDQLQAKLKDDSKGEDVLAIDHINPTQVKAKASEHRQRKDSVAKILHKNVVKQIDGLGENGVKDVLKIQSKGKLVETKAKKTKKAVSSKASKGNIKQVQKKTMKELESIVVPLAASTQQPSVIKENVSIKKTKKTLNAEVLKQASVKQIERLSEKGINHLLKPVAQSNKKAKK